MAFNMYGYSALAPILFPIRPRFFGWVGFMPGWMNYMEWMDEVCFHLGCCREAKWLMKFAD